MQEKCQMCICVNNQLICITNNESLILHHKAFRADRNSRSTKIYAPSAARILIFNLTEYREVIVENSLLIAYAGMQI